MKHILKDDNGDDKIQSSKGTATTICEMQYTEDRVTDGLLEQLQIISVIKLEESILTVKVVVRKGIQYVIRTFYQPNTLIGFNITRGVKQMLKDLIR